MVKSLRPNPATGGMTSGRERFPEDEGEDGPFVDEPSELDDLTHTETVEIYRDASANIRFAKDLMWRLILYFSAGTIAVVGYGELTDWKDPVVSRFLLIIVWFFSVTNVLVLISLQWWQSAERRKILFVTERWSSFANAARSQKSGIMSDVQRYGMILAMILYLELITIAATRIFIEHL